MNSGPLSLLHSPSLLTSSIAIGGLAPKYCRHCNACINGLSHLLSEPFQVVTAMCRSYLSIAIGCGSGSLTQCLVAPVELGTAPCMLLLMAQSTCILCEDYVLILVCKVKIMFRKKLP